MRKYFAEFIGTFLLTFLACGVASFTAGYQGFLGVVGISLIFGFIVAVLCYSIGNISGCHINPAVSLGMLISKRMSIVDFMGYVIAQLLGGVAAGFAMLGISKTFSEDIISQYSSYGYNLLSFGTNGYGDASAFLQVNVWGALIIEFILTFVFVITVIGVTSKPEYKSVSGIVIGLSLARSFGPALARAVNGDIQALSQVWVFIVAPLAGAVVAALVYKLLSYEKPVVTVSETESENGGQSVSGSVETEE